MVKTVEKTKNKKENIEMKKRHSAYTSMPTITMMIRKYGATAEDITEKYGIAESTLRRYLNRYFKRRDTITRYNRLLRENAKAKHASADAKSTESVKITEVVEETAVEETAESNTETTVRIETADIPVFFIIDPTLIQLHDNRKLFGKVMEKIRSEKLNYEIYSKYKLELMSKKSYSVGAAQLAKAVLEDKTIEKAETVLNIVEYSWYLEGCIITDSKSKNSAFMENAYEIITFEEFLKSTPNKDAVCEKDVNSSEYLRKFTIPVSLNKMGRMIIDLNDIQNYLKEVYSANSIVNMKIFAEDGKERNTPTGKLMIKIGDTIKIEAVDEDGRFTANISIIKNDTVNNAVESYYNVDVESPSAGNHSECAV